MALCNLQGRESGGKGRCEMIDALIGKAREYQEHKVDFQVASRDLSFDLMDASMIVGGTSATKLLPTDYARNQLYAKMEPTIFNSPPGDDDQRRGRRSWKEYMDVCKTVDPTMYAMWMNRWMEKMDSKLFVRAYDDKARAVLSDRFAVVDTLECLEWTKKALNQQAYTYKFHNVNLTPDYMRLSISMNEIRVPDGGRNRGTGGVYAIGCDVGTGEIGNTRVWVHPYVQRTSCTNSIVYSGGDYSYQHRHVGIRENVARTFMVCVFNALKGCEEVLQQLVASIEEPMPKIEEVIADMCKRNAWSQELGYGVVMGTETEHSLWGLVQGVSYAANLVDDPEEKLNMQKLAGDLLMRQPAYITEL
jgi:hypothetical protein